MRKYLYIAAVAALALTSCQKEKDINGNNVPGGKNSVSFVLQGGAPTRAADVASPVTKGFSAEVGEVDGQSIFLEETITDLAFTAPVTRGTPLYTENLGYLYRSKLDVHTSTYAAGDVTYSQIGDTQAIENYWCYGYDYPTNIWGDEVTPVDFAFRMPSEMTTHGVSGLSFNGTSTTFTYQSPEKAVETLDIVFGGVSTNYNDYKAAYAKDGGLKVTLYHALTGVKFAVANPKKDGKLEYGIQIDSISFIGLANGGSCTFTPGTNSGSVVWTPSTQTGNVIFQDFAATDLVDYVKDTDSNHFADSYFDGGTTQNINDASASKTFWLVPQEITNSNAKLRIVFTMNGKSNQHMEIRLGDLHSSNWEAGQIRTYTFKLNDVNLKIEDQINMTTKTKNNVVITNTGNTDAYIRAALVGQWLNEEGKPVFGFTDKLYNFYAVASWYEDQFVSTEPGTHGTFNGLAGYKNSTQNPNKNWYLCTDGYYYYSIPLAPNATTGDDELFTSYVVGTAPEVTISGVPMPIHFSLEIATQAISANKLDGTHTNYTWQDAWENATGTRPTVKE